VEKTEWRVTLKRDWSGREDSVQRWTEGPLKQFTKGRQLHFLKGGDAAARAGEMAGGQSDVIVANKILQDLADYRSALREWFALVKPGGHLIVIVPHAFLYERQLALPSPWRTQQRRLYTPGTLAQELEEALLPNEYRVRWLGDLDEDYDYGLARDVEPSGNSDVAVVLERIVPPDWSMQPEPRLANPMRPDPEPYAFEPIRTRIETAARPPSQRILIMKLDHLGDFIMALPALERARRYFPDAHIDLVVGSWNAGMAREVGLADRVIPFDAFPRNSSEVEPNVDATLGLFRETVTDTYDVAVDLRADTDTRILLRAIKAQIKAGIGTRQRFPFMDIALPLDSTRNDAERARDDMISHHSFSLQGSARRSHFGLHSDKAVVERDCAIVWGPYLQLDRGSYIFDFYIDLEKNHGDGLLRLDIALSNGQAVSEMYVSGPGTFQLKFDIDKPGTPFEARIFTVPDQPSISFSFYGGRLIRRTPNNVLHQSEYSSLLIELVKLRLIDFDMLQEVSAA
jgi:hypothetical protein